jgi:hypothetical protein
MFNKQKAVLMCGLRCILGKLNKWKDEKKQEIYYIELPKSTFTKMTRATFLVRSKCHYGHFCLDLTPATFGTQLTEFDACLSCLCKHPAGCEA